MERVKSSIQPNIVVCSAYASLKQFVINRVTPVQAAAGIDGFKETRSLRCRCEAYGLAMITWAWILAATSPFPCRRAMAAVAWSVAASSFSALLASISVRSGVPWQ